MTITAHQPQPVNEWDAELWLSRPSWHSRAACRGMDTNLFFPERGDQNRLAAARAVCAGCAVRVECAGYAATQGPMLSGIWGGQPQLFRHIRTRRKALPETGHLPGGRVEDDRPDIIDRIVALRASWLQWQQVAAELDMAVSTLRKVRERCGIVDVPVRVTPKVGAT